MLLKITFPSDISVSDEIIFLKERCFDPRGLSHGIRDEWRDTQEDARNLARERRTDSIRNSSLRATSLLDFNAPARATRAFLRFSPTRAIVGTSSGTSLVGGVGILLFCFRFITLISSTHDVERIE